MRKSRSSSAVVPIKHARYCWLLLAESHLTRRLFGAMVGRIAVLPAPTGETQAVGAAKRDDQAVGVGEVSMERTGTTGLAGFGFPWQGESSTWRSRKRFPKRELQLGGRNGRQLGVD